MLTAPLKVSVTIWGMLEISSWPSDTPGACNKNTMLSDHVIMLQTYLGAISGAET